MPWAPPVMMIFNCESCMAACIPRRAVDEDSQARARVVRARHLALERPARVAERGARRAVEIRAVALLAGLGDVVAALIVAAGEVVRAAQRASERTGTAVAERGARRALEVRAVALLAGLGDLVATLR